jgi:hypothetical protein
MINLLRDIADGGGDGRIGSIRTDKGFHQGSSGPLNKAYQPRTLGANKACNKARERTGLEDEQTWLANNPWSPSFSMRLLARR